MLLSFNNPFLKLDFYFILLYLFIYFLDKLGDMKKPISNMTRFSSSLDNLMRPADPKYNCRKRANLSLLCVHSFYPDRIGSDLNSATLNQLSILHLTLLMGFSAILQC